jgi:hypothetical protein
MSKLAATLVFAAVGIISPAFALYGSYALSAAPTAKSAFRLFRAGARNEPQKKRLRRWNRRQPHSVLFLKAVEELSSRRPEPL